MTNEETEARLKLVAARKVMRVALDELGIAASRDSRFWKLDEIEQNALAVLGGVQYFREIGTK